MMNQVSIARDPSLIAAEINTIKEQTRVTVLTAAVEIGKRLYEAKGVVQHGQWGAWLEENVEYSERTAQNLMRVFEEYGKKPNPQALADLSYTKAVALLGLPPEEREAFAETHDVEAMSTRELESEIEQLREEKAKQQLTIDELLGKEKNEKKKHDAVRKDWIAAQKDAKEAQAKLAKLEKDLKAASERPPEIVERVPDEVQSELARLRQVAAKAPNEAVIRFRDAYERLKGAFEDVAELLEALDRELPEDAGKYRRAVKAAAERMAEIAGRND